MAQYNANGITGYGVGSPQIGLAPVPEKWNRAPTTSDLGFPYGYLAIYNGSVYAAVGNTAGQANWVVLGGLSDVNTINGLSPTVGNINIAGTANQIAAGNASSTVTLSLAGPHAFSTLTDHGVLVGQGTSAIAALSVGATGTILAGSTGANPAFTASPSVSGSITAGTTLTATLGNITATNGNIVRGTAGNKDIYSSVASTTTAGANSAGSVALTNGTATVATTAVTASSLIRLTRQGIGTTGANILGQLTIGTITAATSFVINAVTAADATALATDDQSIIFWEIVN